MNDAIEIVGALLVIVGVALWSIPAGLIVAGFLCIAYAYLAAKGAE